MASVSLTSQAETDLVDIGVHIAVDNPGAADRWLEMIEQKCRLLATMPQMGADRADLAPNLRGFPVGNYIIFYRPSTDGVVVIRVLHGARDIESLF